MNLIKDYKESELKEILENLKKRGSFNDKFDYLFKKFLNREYVSFPLSKSNEEEKLIFYLKKFDCVTLIETVISLILKSPQNEEEVIENLKRIRYQNGEVHFNRRNHYMSIWKRENGEIVEDVTENFREKFLVLKRLSLIPEIPEVETRIWIISYINLKKHLNELKNGDILLFFSEDNPQIDYFHVGFLKEKNIFHASKTHKRVLLEDLDEFYKRTYFPPTTILRIKYDFIKGS